MRTVRNTALSVVVSGTRVAAVAVTTLWTARALGPDGFGAFTLALTFATMVGVLPDYGFSLQTVASVAGAPAQARSILAATAKAKWILAAIAVAITAVWALCSGGLPGGLPVSVLLIASVIVLSFSQLISYVYRGLDRFDLDATSSIFANGALVLGVAAANVLHAGVLGIAWAFLAARIVYIVVVARPLRRMPRTDEESGLSARAVLVRGFPYGIHTAVAVLYVSVDSLALGHYFGNQQVGFYQAGMRIVFAATLIPEVLTSGLFPTLARAAAQGDQEALHRVGTRLNRYLILSGSAILAVLAVANVELRSMLFGPQYSALDAWLPWFGVIILLRYVAFGYGAIISATGEQTKRTIGTVITGVFNVAAALVLVPRFGAIGALMSSVSTHAVQLVVYALASRDERNGAWVDGRAVVGALTIGVLAIVAHDLHPSHPVTSIVLLIAFLPTAIALSAVTKHELLALRQKPNSIPSSTVLTST